MHFGTRLLIMALVVVIAAILILPRIGGGGDNQGYGAAKSDLATIKSLVDRFKLDNGRFPTASEGLWSLTSPPPDLKDTWKPLSDRPLEKDHWGRPYLYQTDGRSYSVRTLGADGKPGGEGENADLEASG